MNAVSALLTLAARILRAVLFLALFLVMLAVGLVLFGGLLIWGLISGKRPTVMTSGTFQRARQFRSQAFGGRVPPGGEVVDVEVREVPNADPRLER